MLGNTSKMGGAPGQVECLFGNYTGNSSGNLVRAVGDDSITSVNITATGAYTITLKGVGAHYLGTWIALQGTAGTQLQAQTVEYNASAKTIKFEVSNSTTGSLVNLATTQSAFIQVCFVRNKRTST